MASNRLLNVYDFPPIPESELLNTETMAGTGQFVRAVGLVVLKLREEINASKAAGMDAMKLAQDTTTESIRRAWIVDKDGNEIAVRDLSTQDGTADVFYNSLHPKLRQMVFAAYSELHNPTRAEAESFLRSRRIVAG